MKDAIDYIAEAWNNVTQKTIENCWIKTGILPSYDNDMNNINDEVNIRNFEEENELEDLLNELPEVDEIQDYFRKINHNILTEEYLTEEQIISMIQSEKNQVIEESDDDDEIEIIPPVSAKKAIDGLKAFINYFERQNNSEFNSEDLHIFRKYLRIVRVNEINSKKQSVLELYFNDCGV